MVLSKFFQGLLSVLGVLLIVLVGIGIAVKIHDVKDIVRGNIPSNKTIMVTGEAKILVKPDLAYQSYDVVAEGNEEKDVQEKYQKKIQDFLDGLKSIGIDRSNVTTTGFSIAKDTTAAKDKQYKATVTLSVKIEDKKAIDDTIKAVYELAMKQDFAPSPTTSYGQSSGFKDQTVYFTPDIHNQAIDNARKKAQQLVESTGLHLGRIVGVNSYDSTSYYPSSGSSATPVPGIPLAPAELTTSVSVTFEVQ